MVQNTNIEGSLVPSWLHCLQLSHWSLKSSPLQILLLVLIEEEIPKVLAPFWLQLSNYSIEEQVQPGSLVSNPAAACLVQDTRDVLPRDKNLQIDSKFVSTTEIYF